MFPKKFEEFSHCSIIEGDKNKAISVEQLIRKSLGESISFLAYDYPHFDIDDARKLRSFESREKGRKTLSMFVIGSRTDESLQALLKLVEEPALNTKYVFVFNNTGTLPKTFLSRASIIETELEVGEGAEYLDAERFIKMSSVERFKFIHSFIDKREDSSTLRSDSLSFLKNCEIYLNNNITHNKNLPISAIIDSKKALTNQAIPPRLALEHLAVALP